MTVPVTTASGGPRLSFAVPFATILQVDCVSPEPSSPEMFNRTGFYPVVSSFDFSTVDCGVHVYPVHVENKHVDERMPLWKNNLVLGGNR